MIKKTTLILALSALSASMIYGLPFSPKDSLSARTLFEQITNSEKRTDQLNINLDVQAVFNVNMNRGKIEESAFKLNNLRLNIEGNITDRIFYKWTQNLNRSNSPYSLDNTPVSIDCAGVGYRFTPALSTFIGKQFADFGGFEYDLDPVEIYQYSDMTAYINCFLTGINLVWQMNKSQELRFQIVNTRNGSIEDMYGTILPENVQPAKFPLGYNLNWNGSFFDGMLLTRWSVSLFNEMKNKKVFYYALGNELTMGNFGMYFDFMYSHENIDKLGIISEIMASADSTSARAENSRYLSLITKLNYRILPKISLFVKGMYETAGISKTTALIEKGKYRTSWGYLGGIEYYPMKENLHFFICYIGRSYQYTDRAKAFGLQNESPQRLSVGLIYSIPVF